MSDGQLLRLVLITPKPHTDVAHGILINVSLFQPLQITDTLRRICFPIPASTLPQCLCQQTAPAVSLLPQPFSCSDW